MKILLASSEIHPYSKTGGLADMSGALAKGLARSGHQVGVVTPLYRGIPERFPDIKRLDWKLEFPLESRQVAGKIWTLAQSDGLTVYFVAQPEFYGRPGIYQENGTDYADNSERFIFFSKAIAHLALHLDWQPELVHLNDWQTGLTALFLQHHARVTGQGSRPRICMTLHNLAYQGLFPVSQYPLTGLPWDYFVPEGVEFYGQLGCLKAGIVYSDVLTTVSPRHAREIITPIDGCGLDGLLRQRQDILFGILNGVDYDEWNTVKNPHLPLPYCAADLCGKAADKQALQNELGLPAEPELPLFGNIGRLVKQKGVDILLGALEEMLPTGIQFVQLGTGLPQFEKAFQELGKRFPTQAAVRIGFDEGLSHRIEAGCDFYLMPSQFEPCGLNQMYSLRYGTIPIVRATGGLDDTVIDPREDVESANGIKFHEYSGAALAKGIRKALALYADGDWLQRFRQNAMAADFSWERTAQEYLDVYRKAVGK
jgi:starch synthase